MSVFDLIHAAGVVVLFVVGAIGLGAAHARGLITISQGQLAACIIFAIFGIFMWPLLLAAGMVAAVGAAIFYGLFFIGKKLGTRHG